MRIFDGSVRGGRVKAAQYEVAAWLRELVGGDSCDLLGEDQMKKNRSQIRCLAELRPVFYDESTNKSDPFSRSC